MGANNCYLLRTRGISGHSKIHPKLPLVNFVYPASKNEKKPPKTSYVSFKRQLTIAAKFPLLLLLNLYMLPPTYFFRAHFQALRGISQL